MMRLVAKYVYFACIFMLLCCSVGKLFAVAPQEPRENSAPSEAAKLVFAPNWAYLFQVNDTSAGRPNLVRLDGETRYQPTDISLWRFPRTSLPAAQSQNLQAVSLNGNGAKEPLSARESRDTINVVIRAGFEVFSTPPARRRREPGTHIFYLLEGSAPKLIGHEAGNNQDYIMEGFQLMPSSDVNLFSTGPIEYDEAGNMLQHTPETAAPSVVADLIVEVPSGFGVAPAFNRIDHSDTARIFRDGYFHLQSDGIRLTVSNDIKGDSSLVGLGEKVDGEVLNARHIRLDVFAPAPYFLSEWLDYQHLSTQEDLTDKALTHLMACICTARPELADAALEETYHLAEELRQTPVSYADTAAFMRKANADVAAWIARVGPSQNRETSGQVRRAWNWYLRYLKVILPSHGTSAWESRIHNLLAVQMLRARPDRMAYLDPFEPPGARTFTDYTIQGGESREDGQGSGLLLQARANLPHRQGALWFDAGPQTEELVKNLAALTMISEDELVLGAVNPQAHQPSSVNLGKILQARSFGTEGPVLLLTSRADLVDLPKVESVLASFEIQSARVNVNVKFGTMMIRQHLRLPDLDHPEGRLYELELTGTCSGALIDPNSDCSGADCIRTYVQKQRR